jgi:hypothetical protein
MSLTPQAELLSDKAMLRVHHGSPDYIPPFSEVPGLECRFCCIFRKSR